MCPGLRAIPGRTCLASLPPKEAQQLAGDRRAWRTFSLVWGTCGRVHGVNAGSQGLENGETLSGFPACAQAFPAWCRVTPQWGRGCPPVRAG